MSKLKVIDREACYALRQAIDDKLAAVGEQFGVCIRAGNATFDSGQVTFKVECALIGDNGEVYSKEAMDFKRYAHRYGLQPADLFREFIDFSGKRFKVVGCKTRSRNYPIVCQQIGRSTLMKFPAAVVKMCLDKMR